VTDTALTTGTFDYSGLDAEARIVVQQRTGEIKGLMRRTASDIVEVGQKLIEVKDRLPHGAFGPWLAAEFEWTERTARRFMSVATAFKSDTVSALNADARTLYLLAAASTPDEARDDALQQAQAGERITFDRAQAIVNTHRPPAVTSYPEDRDEDPYYPEADEEIESEYRVESIPPPAEPSKPAWSAPVRTTPAAAVQVGAPARRPEPARPAPAPAPAPRPAPVMVPLKSAPVQRNVVVTVTIWPGEDLAGRRVMVAIAEQGAMIEQMRGGVYGDMLNIVRELCEAKLGQNGSSDTEILMEV